MRILLIEDDTSIAKSLVEAFRRLHDGVDVLGAAEPALAALENTAYDLAIVDVGLPGMSGFELVGRLRARGQAVPALILTARDSVEDRVKGLNMGADDYLAKPFALDELVARSQALVRRSRAVTSPRMQCGALRLDVGAREASLDGQPLELTAREVVLLEQLLLASPGVVSKQRLADSLGRWDREITPNAIEIYVSRLRARLASSDVEIRTMRGLGYRLVTQAAGPAA